LADLKSGSRLNSTTGMSD